MLRYFNPLWFVSFVTPAWLPIAAAAITIGSAVLGHSSAKKQKKKMRKAALDIHAQELEVLADMGGEIDRQTTQKMSVRAREALVQRGRLAAIAAESGISGNTQGRLTAQAYFDEGSDQTQTLINRNSAQRQLLRERESSRLRYESAYHGAAVPSGLAAGLQIVGGLLGGLSKTPAGKTPTTGDAFYDSPTQPFL